VNCTLQNSAEVVITLWIRFAARRRFDTSLTNPFTFLPDICFDVFQLEISDLCQVLPAAQPRLYITRPVRHYWYCPLNMLPRFS